jgi:hypothetical protein
MLIPVAARSKASHAAASCNCGLESCRDTDVWSLVNAFGCYVEELAAGRSHVHINSTERAGSKFSEPQHCDGLGPSNAFASQGKLKN